MKLSVDALDNHLGQRHGTPKLLDFHKHISGMVHDVVVELDELLKSKEHDKIKKGRILRLLGETDSHSSKESVDLIDDPMKLLMIRHGWYLTHELSLTV